MVAQCGQLWPCWSPAHKADPSFHRRAPSRASFCVRHTKQLPDSPMTSYERVRATHVTWCVHSRELHATTPLQRCRATTGARAEGALASAGRKWRAWLLCSGRHAAVLVPMEQEPRRDTLLCCLYQCLLLGLLRIISSGHGPPQWTPFEALCGLSLSGPARRGPHWGERGERKLARERRCTAAAAQFSMQRAAPAMPPRPHRPRRWSVRSRMRGPVLNLHSLRKASPPTVMSGGPAG